MMKKIVASTIACLSLLLSSSARAADPKIVETGRIHVLSSEAGAIKRHIIPHQGTEFLRYSSYDHSVVYIDKKNLSAIPTRVSHVYSDRLADSKSGRYSIARPADWSKLSTPDFLLIDAKSGQTTTFTGLKDDKYPAPIFAATVRFSADESRAAILSYWNSPFIVLDIATRKRTNLEAGPDMSKIRDQGCDDYHVSKCPDYDFQISDDLKKLEFVASFDTSKPYLDDIYYFSWDLKTLKLTERKLLGKGDLQDVKFVASGTVLINVYDPTLRTRAFRLVDTASGKTTFQFENGQMVKYFPSTNLFLVYMAPVDGPQPSGKTQALDATSLQIIWEAEFPKFGTRFVTANHRGFVWRSETPPGGGIFDAIYFANADTAKHMDFNWKKRGAFLPDSFAAYDNDELVAVTVDFDYTFADFQFFKIK